MAVIPSSLEYQYRRIAGGDSNNQKATYAIEFSANGQNYTFIPDSVITQGVQAGNAQYVMPWFLNQENLGQLGKTGQRVDLNGVSWYGDYLKDTVGASTSGFLVPSGVLEFDSNIKSPPLDKGKVKGVGNTNEGLAYVMETPEGALGRYIASDGKTTTLTQTQGRSLLGRILGSGFDDLTAATGIQDLAGGVNQFFQTPIGKATLLAAGAAAGGAFGGAETAGVGAGAGAGAGLSGYDLAMADLAAGAPAFTGAEMAAAGGAGGGLFGGTSGAGAGMGGAQGLTMPAAGGGTLTAGGVTGTTPFGGLGAELGTTGLAAGTGSLLTGAAAGVGAGALGAGAAGALTASELGKLGLIQGGLGLLGGLTQGQSAKGAAETLAAQQAALAEKTLGMGKFQPVGVTTRFGTSAFTTDPTTGAITPSYTLSPEAKAYQDALAGMATQGLTAGQGLMSLGQQYIGESPEAVRKRYMETQLATLAPAQEQTLAGIRNQLQQTGRGGFATGATSPAAGGLLATSPELAAYYNSLANTQRQLAAEAEKQYQGQVNFGQGLLTGAVKPFESAFGAQKAVETAGQQPLGLSMDFANLVAQRGSDQARNYAAAMAPSLQAQYSANAFNPWATAIQGASSNPLTTYGLYRLATG